MSRSPVEVRFSRLNCVAVHLSPADPVDLLNQFVRRVGAGSGGVYSGEVAILDGSHWDQPTPPPFAELAQAARQAGVLLAGARHWPQALHADIEKAGISLVEDVPTDGAGENATAPEKNPTSSPVASAGTVPAATRPADAAPAAAQAQAGAGSQQTGGETLPTVAGAPTLLIDHPVRSGQKIYARGCDAVVMGSVNAGAEIIADGNIHVYGALRGRALAGANGNSGARIIATSFAPELVAIAGYYLTFENGFPADCENNPVKIHLEDQASHLKIEPLNIR